MHNGGDAFIEQRISCSNLWPGVSSLLRAIDVN
jgi:hypothetical protein